MNRKILAVVASGLFATLASTLAWQGTPAAQGAQGKGCLQWQDIEDGDGDFKRNAKALNAGADKLCFMQDEFTEGGLRWVFQIIVNKENPKGPLWAVPHDSEDAAFDTAVTSVIRHGGRVVAVETGGKRNNGKQDPNRNFDPGSKVKSACPLQVAPSPIYTERFLYWWDRDYPIIALHSNSASGSISIKSKANGRVFPSPSPIGGKNPDHTLIFVASVASPERDQELRSFVSRLNQSGIHVVYETVSPTRNDCSMSNYAALNNIRNYVNVEVVHGDAATQRQIVSAIMKLWPDHRIGPLGKATDTQDTVATIPDSEPPPAQPKQAKKSADAPTKATKGKRLVLDLGPVQDNRKNAETEARQLNKMYADVLGAHQAKIREVKSKSSESVRYRIIAGPLPEQEAKALCANLKSAGASCSMPRP